MILREADQITSLFPGGRLGLATLYNSRRGVIAQSVVGVDGKFDTPLTAPEAGCYIVFVPEDDGGCAHSCSTGVLPWRFCDRCGEHSSQVANYCVGCGKDLRA